MTTRMTLFFIVLNSDYAFIKSEFLEKKYHLHDM
jgi:hypothetical protein